jgi:hypothetical protein
MANVIYPKAYDAIARGLVDFSPIGGPVDTFSAVLVAGISYSAADEFRDDYGTGNEIVAPVTITCRIDNLTPVVQTYNDTPTFAPVGAFNALVLFQDTGSSATDRLIAWIDRTRGGAPLGFVGDGSPVTFVWSGVGTPILRF